MLASAIAGTARAENTRQTVSWGPYDRKDPLTDKVMHQVAGQVDFPDGNMAQAYARCREDLAGERWPGLTIAIGSFYGENSKPKAFTLHNNEVQLPLTINNQSRPAVHIPSDNPRINFAAIGFYDPTAARRYAHVSVPGYLQLPELANLGNAEQQIAWKTFLAGTGGTLKELLGAASIRVQLPLFDGSADVVELNPQDPVLKSYVQQCSSGF